MSRAKTFAGALTLVLLVSCGGSTKNAAPAAPPVSLAIATTAAPTTAATTLPVQSAPATTAASTTTTMSLKDLELVVRKAHADYWTSAIRCIAAPSSCNPDSFTAADTPLRARVSESTKALAEKNWVVRQNASDPGVAVVQSVAFNDKRTEATLKECVWDSAVTLQPNAGPNGEDIIVDDSKASYEGTVTVVLSDGTWVLSNRTQLSEHDGVNLCDAR